MIKKENKIENFDGEKVTVYLKSEFTGEIHKREIKLFSLGYKEYAQYPSVPVYTYVLKGKRKRYQHTISGFKSCIVIIKGWDKLNPENQNEIISSDEIATVSKIKCNIGNPQKFEPLVKKLEELNSEFLIKEFND